MNNNNNLSDRRCIKTRKAIKQVFIRLMTEKDINKITIKEIADEANINRKTFYSHYRDVNGVLDDIENDILEQLCGIIENLDIQKAIYDPYPIFKELTNIINNDFNFYKYLLQSTSHSRLLEKIKHVLKKRIVEILGTEISNKEMLPYAIEFALSGILSIYQEWLNSDRAYSLEEISAFAGSLTFNGLYTIFKSIPKMKAKR
ncbi:MAG TPA: TetR/AcrR family transcriptional regulator [Clostridiaceae bacterium]|nr:TetR/AcrR family transcriptional regulator [Clostridiaceae bacterium]